MLGDRADHIEPCCFCQAGRGLGVWPPIFGKIQSNALHPLRGIEIARPIPGCDAEVNGVVLRRDAHHLGAAPCDRPHIGVDELVPLQDFGLCRINLGDPPGHFKVENAGGIRQPARVLARFEDSSAISALALEDRTRVMQPVSEHVDLGVAPFDHSTVQPNPSVAIVKSRAGHGAFLSRGNELVWFLRVWV